MTQRDAESEESSEKISDLDSDKSLDTNTHSSLMETSSSAPPAKSSKTPSIAFATKETESCSQAENNNQKNCADFSNFDTSNAVDVNSGVETRKKISSKLENLPLPKSDHLLKKEKRRKQVLMEILDTERTYVSSLKILYEIFIFPIKESLNTPKPILSVNDSQYFFTDIEVIVHVNLELLKMLSDFALKDKLIESDEKFDIRINGFSERRKERSNSISGKHPVSEKENDHSIGRIFSKMVFFPFFFLKKEKKLN